MSISKLEKFDAIDAMDHVFQNRSFENPKLIANHKEINNKNNWKQLFFKNNNPIIVELACGKGEYTVELARRNPNINYIGVDIKGNRIYSGATLALNENLKNVCFIRTTISLLHHFIEKDEIDEVWITFPDPFPSFSDRGNRLISPKFLTYYQTHFSSKKITYHLKTDNFPLFRYAVGVLDGRGETIIKCIENIYSKDKKIEDYLRIQTYYEKLHQSLGSDIHYVQWVM